MRSMTGYGSFEGRVGNGVVFAEVRSVNSRFLDINCKLPPSMYVLEPKIKKLLQNNIIRGKVDVFIKERVSLAETAELTVNKALVRQYKKCLGEITQMLGLKASSHLLEVVDLKDLVVYRERPLDMDSFWKQISATILKALKKFDDMRVAEGQELKKDQIKRIAELERLVNLIERRSNTRLSECRRRIEDHIRDGTPSDAEVNDFSDRLDISEEITRLRSHIKQYRSLINRNGAVGRQIDFLIQEIHREINTLGSKAGDGQVANLVVEAKAELEKLREQVQNVE